MSFRSLPRFCLLVGAVAFAAFPTFAQTRCLTPDQIKQFTQQIENGNPRPFNLKLAEHLNKLFAKHQEQV